MSNICVCDKHVWTRRFWQKEKTSKGENFRWQIAKTIDGWCALVQSVFAPHLRDFVFSKILIPLSSGEDGELIGSRYESKDCVRSKEHLNAISLGKYCIVLMEGQTVEIHRQLQIPRD